MHQLLPYIITETAAAVAKDMRAKERKNSKLTKDITHSNA